MVKNIQTAGYNGACTVIHTYLSWVINAGVQGFLQIIGRETHENIDLNFVIYNMHTKI